MEIILRLIAELYIVMSIIYTLFTPLVFGEPRKPYDFWGWLLQLPFNIGLVIILLRFLGVINSL